MESCVKNCGSIVHDEIATKAFMEEVREMIKHSKEESVKAKLLELLQRQLVEALQSGVRCFLCHILKKSDTFGGA